MPTQPNPDFSLDGQPKRFILLRPFFALWNWLFPGTLAEMDRQSKIARWIARITIVVVFVSAAVAAVKYAKPIQDAYQDWKAERLVKEARQFFEDRLWANSLSKAQEAVTIAPDNVNAMRCMAELLTAFRKNEALHFLDRLEQAGAATAADRQLRVRALLNVGRVKEASQLLEQLLETEEPNDTLMRLAEEMWDETQRDTVLLRSMKAYAEQNPDNKNHSLRLARAQALSKTDAEVSAGMRRAYELAQEDDEVGLRALEFLDSFESLPPEESNMLIRRLRNHPKAGGKHFVAALKRQVLLEPARKPQLIREAIDHARGKSREDLVPMVRWLLEQGEPLQVIALVDEEDAKSYQPLLENYLTALTMLQRSDDLERMVNDPKVAKLLSQSVRAFYRAHLAFVTRKAPEEIREALIGARNAADVERRPELLLSIADYAEKRGYSDIAEEAYRSASMMPRREREAYQGLLRTAELNGKTEALLKAAKEANVKWPDDPNYLERYIYASLLTGHDMETAFQRALSLLDLQPVDCILMDWEMP
ncbi:MAG TPA: hypothetical protein VD994_13235, partial [Prosthecobacter sp.]|nr:hypothetical protein [Prosthecobacter sp.]